MNDVATVLTLFSGVAVVLEWYGLWMNARDYVVPAMCSARYAPVVRTRVLAFAEPRLRQFFQSRYKSIGWVFFFGPLLLSGLTLGRSWQTATLGAANAAHVAVMWLAWYHWRTVWQLVTSLPYEAKKRYVILQAVQRSR